MSHIHPTAVVADGAEIADDAIIGPYCTISSQAVIGSGTELMSHVVIEGNTTLGSNNRVSPFAVLGGQTQDLKYEGGNPGVKIGDNNTIREYVTINCATNDGEFTTLGNDCHILAYSHFGHDCHIGNGVIVVNACQVAGHVIIEDMATIEGSVGIVQFMRIGSMAYIGAMSKINKDVPPYMIAHGDPVQVRSINRIGMERRGIDDAGRKAIKDAYRILYRQDAPVSEALNKIEAEVDLTPEVKHLLKFCRASEKGIAR